MISEQPHVRHGASCGTPGRRAGAIALSELLLDSSVAGCLTQPWPLQLYSMPCYCGHVIEFLSKHRRCMSRFVSFINQIKMSFVQLLRMRPILAGTMNVRAFLFALSAATVAISGAFGSIGHFHSSRRLQQTGKLTSCLLWFAS